jgi:hypothetical protein
MGKHMVQDCSRVTQFAEAQESLRLYSLVQADQVPEKRMWSVAQETLRLAEPDCTIPRQAVARELLR